MDAVAARVPAAPAGGRHPFLRDLVYGANDGIITTFAVVSGVAGASLSAAIVLILGVANLIADGISMGASNYLGIRSEQDAEGVSTAENREALRRDAMRHGFATFAAFVVAGSIPLLAYLLPLVPSHRFPTAGALTLATLFGVGTARSLATARPWWRSGMEMLLVGAAAAAVAFAAGHLIAGFVGTAGA